MSREELAAQGITESTVAAMLEGSAWVAADGGRIVAFSMILPQDACLFAAFVLPEYENRGLGKKLVLNAEEALFEHHALIWLETCAKTRAAGFYQHLGWVETRSINNGDIRLEKQRR
ncbi:GNAT family N-acetyltransferase [uncultured Pluralibacter sp.]|uniref:GNAT family N-acetyltransferase n=1 Tax=uncultured Pluralibacter sp. TaxID=1490864 RepID=UPI0026231A81|nr:GNAT family N-acetyltransferase [uncultured Pluralibacter sp.]